MDKGGGPQKWISDEGGGSLRVYKKNSIVNIINSKKVDKPRGGGGLVKVYIFLLL